MNSERCFELLEKNRYLEKKIKRWVVASPDTLLYLSKIGFGNKPRYAFTKDIIKATKTLSPFDAKFLIDTYHEDTGDNIDLVAIPLEVTYELINEVVNSGINDVDIAEDIMSGKKMIGEMAKWQN